VPGPSPGEWSSIRGISAYRFWDIAIENVVVKMAAYLLNGNQPPLIIALECEREKEGPDLPSQRKNFDQDKITMLVL
jgi:hypothetical protein